MTELSTLITDYVLGGLTAVLGFILLRNRSQSLPVRLWGFAFLASAFAAFAGGTWHGFRLMLGETALFWIWKAAIYFVSAFGLAAMSGTILSAFSGRIRIGLLAFAAAIAVVYATWMATRDDFIYVIYFNAAAMVFVLAVQAYTAFRWRDPASPAIVGGILVSGIAALVQATGVSLHDDFNNNDLFHVIQMLGVYLLFCGAKQLRPAHSHDGRELGHATTASRETSFDASTSTSPPGDSSNSELRANRRLANTQRDRL